MDLELTGKHVFVAGASRGIGRAIAHGFLAEGAKVTLTARTAGPLNEFAAELEAAHPGRVLAIAGDMTADGPITAALDSAIAKFGPIYSVIANVGLGPSQDGIKLSGDDWRAGLNQNLVGSMVLAGEALTRMAGGGTPPLPGANVILISSIAGLAALGTPLTYGASKAALDHGAKALAAQVGKIGLRVNAVAPGNIIFPGGTWEKAMATRPDDWGRWIKREVPLRRFGKPEEIADACLFLASPRASFITGAILTVDGGQVKGL